MAHVTFVIATYRRADALRSTVRSLLQQTHRDWTALVIGDRCGDETADALRAFGDPRVRYYNLPERFGEQSGPNSAGLHLAGGDFVAFLNHDDLLLQDHVAHMLACLKGADFCFGRFATATRVAEGAPVFTRVGPEQRDLSEMLQPSPWIFDPSSFWMIRTAYARRVGPWRAAGTVRRTPIRDWLLRAWRLGGGFCFAPILTGLRFQTLAGRAGAPVYDSATPEHEVMAARIERETPEEIRSFVEAQVRAEAATAVVPPGRPRWRRALGWGRRRVYSALYLGLGIDPDALLGRLSGRRKGELLDWLSRSRTGEALPREPTLATFLRDPEAYRII